MTYVGVLDCNNFFVSCERLFRPDLHDKPVIVLSSNDGCVVARSQEVKDMGIPMGVPYFKVKDTIKDNSVVVFSSHFALYRDISQRVFTVMKDKLDTVEQYSVDEAFFLINDSDEVMQFASSIKDKVEQVVGIPVSIGVGRSKTLAKLANGVAKRTTGVTWFTDAGWEEERARTLLRDLWGVGRQTTVVFQKLGLHTAADFLAIDPAQLEQVFGVFGVRLRAELLGTVNLHETVIHTPQKSLMSSRSFQATTTNYEVVADAVAYHVRQAAEELRAMCMRAGHLRVSVQPSRYSDYVLQGISGEKYLEVPTNETKELLQVTHELLKKNFQPNVPYKKAGVFFSHFVPQSFDQQPLFTDLAATTTELDVVIDKLNKEAGKPLITMGNHLKMSEWHSRSDTRSPAYTTNWSQLPRVSAN
ncbi:MAG: Y-family DNA polymerase [Patescibacteria group bacterium]